MTTNAYPLVQVRWPHMRLAAIGVGLVAITAAGPALHMAYGGWALMIIFGIGGGGAILASRMDSAQPSPSASRRTFDPGVFHGYDGIREFAARLREVWESGRIEPLEFIPTGDEVVVPVRLAFVSRTDRQVLTANAAHVWTLRDGRVIRYCVFQTKAEALEALRLLDNRLGVQGPGKWIATADHPSIADVALYLASRKDA